MATLKQCLHVLLAARVASLLLLGLAETSVVDSVAGLEATVVDSEVDFAAAIGEGMVEEEEGLGTKEEEDLEAVGEAAMVERPMASVMAQHHLLTHLPVQVETEADSLVGMAAAVTADHQLTAA